MREKIINTMYNRGKRGDATLVLGISVLISFILLLLLIAIFPLKVERKPLYIVTVISGLVVFFAVFSSYALTWWYGIMVFGGLLFALAILVGKKMEWLKPINTTEKDEIVHKPFPLEFKGSENGQSVFDEEFRQMVVVPNHEQATDEAMPALMDQDYLNVADASNDQSDEMIMEAYPDYIEMTEPTQSMELIELDNVNKLAEEPVQEELKANDVEDIIPEKDVTLSMEVEELSDEWLNSRLNALYGDEQAAAIDNDDSYNNQPLDSLIDVEQAYSDLNDVKVEVTDKDEKEVEFEDLSQLYYKGQRGENDGTTE